MTPRRSESCIVVFDRRDIDFLPPYQLALQLAKDVDTFVIQGAVPLRRISSIFLKSRFTPASTGRSSDRLPARYSPLMLPERSWCKPAFAPWNRAALRSAVGHLTRAYDQVTLLFDNECQSHFIGKVGRAATAYYLYDDYGVDLTGRPDARCNRTNEQALMSSVDAVFAVSHKLCEYASAYNAHVHYLPNGYNADFFFPTPGDRAPYPARRPVIGYVGTISGRVDFTGLYLSATQCPGFDFHMVGQVSPDIEHELTNTDRPANLAERFFALPNVTLHAPLPLAAVRDVMATFDVALIPYCLNAFTLASCPLKMYEYYALGLPVVSTNIPEVTRFDAQVLIAKEASSYKDMICQALSDAHSATAVERRLCIAASNSTAVRAKTFLDWARPMAKARRNTDK